MCALYFTFTVSLWCMALVCSLVSFRFIFLELNVVELRMLSFIHFVPDCNGIRVSLSSSLPSLSLSLFPFLVFCDYAVFEQSVYYLLAYIAVTLSKFFFLSFFSHHTHSFDQFSGCKEWLHSYYSL